MTNKERSKLQALIRKHVKTQVALSWAGSQEPEDRELIEANAKEAKQSLYNWIALRTDPYV